MTDIRDRDPEIEMVAEETPIAARAVPVEAPRSSLVGRALAPLRRARGRQLATVPVLDRQIVPDTIEEPRSRLRQFILMTMLLVVVLPTAAAGIYLFVFASDQFVAETRFAVRNATAPSGADGVTGDAGGMGGGGAMSLLMGGPNLAGEDAGIIANYIHSRAAIEDISRQIDVRAIFERPEADFWARLPSNATAEKLTTYWNRMISVYVESSSGIVQVSASAFRRQDALDLTKAILAASEKLANSLNLKMQADQSRLAEDEVRRSEGNVRFALADLTSFRNSQHLIDPVESAKSTGKPSAAADGRQDRNGGQPLRRAARAGPERAGDRRHQGAPRQHQYARRRIAEPDGGRQGNHQEHGRDHVAVRGAGAQETFAEKMFEFSRQGLERARLTAIQQSIYLAVFVPPSLPQEFTYPERFIDLFLVLLVSFMTWASGAVISASILDHRL